MSKICATHDLLVFSHLRWDFVFQRPQHLLSRFTPHRRVFFFEEPICNGVTEPMLHLRQTAEGVQAVVPHLPQNWSDSKKLTALHGMVNELLGDENIRRPTVWYYTPMALPYTEHIEASAVIYDCMDELSSFKFAPPTLADLEKRLFEKAHLVYTGGHSLYEFKRSAHRNIHPLPSSIDRAHFAQARRRLEDPADQARIPRPRIGFFGVIDERMDIELLRGIAELRPQWNFILLGPIVKVAPESLPQAENIHYLGKKDYQELPNYLSSWDLAMMPFALNESTRFISPTKTPEYLAAGRPVVSTPIRDVVRPYGEERLVHIAETPDEFVHAAERAMHERKHDLEWLLRVDEFLEGTSWDLTWSRMAALELKALERTEAHLPIRPSVEPASAVL